MSLDTTGNGGSSAADAGSVAASAAVATGSAASGAAGVGLATGTGFTGVVLLLFPDGIWKSLLLIVAPTVTVIISATWSVTTSFVEAKITNWRLDQEKKSALARLEEEKAKPNPNPKAIADAQEVVDAISRLETELAKKRVTAIVK
jgi:hypothetical protein